MRLGKNVNIYGLSAPLNTIIVGVEVDINNCVCGVVYKAAGISRNCVAVNGAVRCDDIELCAVGDNLGVYRNVTGLRPNTCCGSIACKGVSGSAYG